MRKPSTKFMVLFFSVAMVNCVLPTDDAVSGSGSGEPYCWAQPESGSPDAGSHDEVQNYEDAAPEQDLPESSGAQDPPDVTETPDVTLFPDTIADAAQEADLFVGGDSGGLDDVQTEPNTVPDATTDLSADPSVGEILEEDGGVPTPVGSAVEREGTFMGTPERFNRYYTDPDWTPDREIFVSPTGSGSGAEPGDPASVSDAFASVDAGEQITFLAAEEPYRGCWQLNQASGGTYDEPIVLYAERNADGERGVEIECCATGRQSCFNLEGANYVAIDGFVLEGGRYGVRSVGLDFASPLHQRGIAMLNNLGFDQCADPFFTGQSDWLVVEGNTAHGGGSCDGHGIYLSNGGDWMIVRNNELFWNTSADFQINADPISTCAGVGIPYDDPRCDGSAIDGLGQGVSEFVLVESNYFHNGFAQGPNFTSVRNSVVRNNVIGLYDRHGTSFWQETSNPALGSSDNLVHHNLFIGDNASHVLQFANHSDRNDVRNNVFLGLSLSASNATASSSVVLLDVDASDNVFDGNFYVGGTFYGQSPTPSEFTSDDFDAEWFQAFPLDRMGFAQGFRPSESAPFLDIGERASETPCDFNHQDRSLETDLGPFEE